MDDIKDNNECISIYDNDIEYYINEFIEVYNIENMKSESQSTWNSCLLYVCRKLFYKNDVLKDMATIYGAMFNYNYKLLDSICDYYLYICYLYNKECNINGFCKLTGIENDTIARWRALENENPTACGIYKKLICNRLDYLSGKLSDGKQNPVGVIAILNHFYGWNSAESENAIESIQTTKQLTAKYSENV